MKLSSLTQDSAVLLSPKLLKAELDEALVSENDIITIQVWR